MFKYLLEGSKIRKIASRLPIELLEVYEEKDFYSRAEVVAIYAQEIGLDDDVQIAFAMFCSPSEYVSLAELQKFKFGYAELREKVGHHCFSGRLGFNFKNLHDYARARQLGNSISGDFGLGGCDGDGGG
ncbi:DUF6559 family protein [Aliagarivorans marinus]|uniref:DUF6559 family protein n=1 Tax=Aliagarivorans marinus TaxID=561965 RepID=UPI00047BAC4D|nr:DUF6559 family protein [Aliagarivorans marinus]